ncbi:MAG: AAA family ATPase [Bernardetiaceae bacterium]|nr:AAA family ATPase [Bernardetiaceae bacterium]
MLRKMRIKQFKCFLDTEISFGKITALAGGNGVGKSSVVQGLLLLRRLYQTYETKEAESISINDKEKTFLELGSTSEIINTNAKDKTFSFELFDDKDAVEIAHFESELNKPRSLKGLLKSTNENRLPFYNDFHYLNAERLGPRNTQQLTTQNFIHVGFQGEYTGQAIADSMTHRVDAIRKRRDTTKFGVTIQEQIEAWMDFIVPDVQFNVQDYEAINQVRIGIKKLGADTDFLHPNNIGFGISYVLPIVVTGLIAQKGSLIIIENPEAHLHPFGQSRIGQFLGHMAGAGLQIIVETHSEHVINGIRIASLKDHVSYKDVVINFFSQEKNKPLKVIKIELNETSDLQKFPSGFFDQGQRDFAEIMHYKKQRK